jgi:hypothetical protein
MDATASPCRPTAAVGSSGCVNQKPNHENVETDGSGFTVLKWFTNSIVEGTWPFAQAVGLACEKKMKFQ